MAIIVDVPVENSFDALGCRKAGIEILKNFRNAENKGAISEFGKEIANSNVDILHFDFENSRETEIFDKIYKDSLEVLSKKEKTIFLGGDHSISKPLIDAFCDVSIGENKKPFLIVFDAHADCRKVESNKNSNGNNMSWLRDLINSGKLPGSRIILIGLRNSSIDENNFLEENKVMVYPMKNIIDFNEICDIVMELANKHEIYVSIDIDVVDGVFVPGTARLEAGGFTSRQLIYFLQRINLIKSLRAIDICEINPDKDVNNMTIKLGVKLVEELI